MVKIRKLLLSLPFFDFLYKKMFTLLNWEKCE